MYRWDKGCVGIVTVIEMEPDYNNYVYAVVCVTLIVAKINNLTLWPEQAMLLVFYSVFQHFQPLFLKVDTWFS